MAPDRYRILPTTEVKQTIQRTVHAHTPRDVAVNMAEKEGIPALAPINQSDTDAQTINIVAVHRSETQSVMLGAMLAPMGC